MSNIPDEITIRKVNNGYLVEPNYSDLNRGVAKMNDEINVFEDMKSLQGSLPRLIKGIGLSSVNTANIKKLKT